MTERPDVELVVDELVLRGIAPERSWEIAAALEAGLQARAQRWRRNGDPLAPRAEASRRAPAVTADASPGALGDAAAAAVWRAIDRGGRG